MMPRHGWGTLGLCGLVRSDVRAELLGGWGFGGWDVGTRFGGRSGCAAQNLEDGRGHGFVGVGQEEAYLPYLVVTKLGFEGRHAGESDAVKDFPVGFARGVVADADDIGVVVMRFKQGWRIGIHVVADGGRLAVQSMAEGTAFNVDTGASGEVCRIGLHVGADLLFLNARIEGHMNNLALMWERRIRDGYRDIAIHKVSENDKGHEGDADDQSEQEPHGWCSLRRFSSYCMRQGQRRKELACVQWMTAPYRRSTYFLRQTRGDLRWRGVGCSRVDDSAAYFV